MVPWWYIVFAIFPADELKTYLKSHLTYFNSFNYTQTDFYEQAKHIFSFLPRSWKVFKQFWKTYLRLYKDNGEPQKKTDSHDDISSEEDFWKF